MLKLKMTEWNTIDLALIDAAEDPAADNLKTEVYAILFTDQRAPAQRVDGPYDQRGWWYDPTAGTGLWYVRRQALSAAAKQETIAMIKQALLAHVSITAAEVIEQGQLAGNISSLVLSVNGIYDGVKFSVALPTLAFTTT